MQTHCPEDHVDALNVARRKKETELPKGKIELDANKGYVDESRSGAEPKIARIRVKGDNAAIRVEQPRGRGKCG